MESYVLVLMFVEAIILTLNTLRSSLMSAVISVLILFTTHGNTLTLLILNNCCMFGKCFAQTELVPFPVG